MNKILIVTLSNLGDVVLTLPVFQALFQTYPKAELHAIVGPNARSVFENDHRIHRLTVYDKKGSFSEKWKLLQQVRNERYDVIVDLRYSLIGLLGGARKRNVYLKFLNKKGHRVDRHLSALKGIVDTTPGVASAQQGWLYGNNRGARKTDSDQRLVVAAVGSKSDIKKWPAGHFAQLLDRLSFEQSCRIVLIGDKQDGADAQKVKHLMISSAQDCTGQTDWSALISLIEGASLVVTNDSAPLHIADSLQVPTLAIFGPTDPVKYGPRSPVGTAVTRKIFCSPCETAQCRYNHECLKELRPDEVYGKALELLNGQTHTENFKILIVRLDRLGDLVLSLPAIDALRRKYPNAKISVMTRPETQELLEGHPWVDEVIAYAYEKKGKHGFGLGFFRFMKEIIRRRFDAAFILHPSTRSYLVPFLAGIPRRFGHQSRWGFLLSQSVPDHRHKGIRHESEYALEVVRAFGVETPQDLQPRLFPSVLLGAKIANKFGMGAVRDADEWLAIHPGSSCPSKRWNLERFEALGNKILQQFPHRLVIIGGKDEVELGHRLEASWGDRALDLTGKLSLKELPAVLERCELLLSNDSGPVHVAAALGTRVISIFGRNQAGLGPQRWRPLGEGHAVIQKDVGCVQCLAHRCPIEFECLKAVEVEDVFTIVRNMLAQPIGAT
jgi:heptosyltransferase-2